MIEPTLKRAILGIVFVFSLVALLALSVRGSTGDSSPSPSRANAERLKIGRFVYRTVMNGKDAGTSETTISKSGVDRFVFTNHVSGAFAQQWEAVATVTFVPVSAKLAFGEGDKLRPRFELNYREGRATGWRLEKSTDNKIDIDSKILPDTVDQRIDWAAAMSQELIPEREFSFTVFDPVTQVSHVAGRVVGLETVNTPAGTFAAVRIAYTIEKREGSETYQVLVNAEGARILLREEFPDGTMEELVRFNE